MVIGTFSSTADAKTGEEAWQLNNGIQTSTQIVRSLYNRKDAGIASVVHVFTGVEAGSQINLQHNSSGGSTITTRGGNLVAIPLSVSTGEKLNYDVHQQSSGFQTQSTTFVSLSYTNAADALPYTGAPATLSLESAAGDAGIFASMNFMATSAHGINTGVFDLFMTNDVTSAKNQENTRYFAEAGGYRSGGSVGYFSGLETGNYTIYGRRYDANNAITAPEVILVGFSTKAIPEPAGITLITLLGGGIILTRRWFS